MTQRQRIYIPLNKLNDEDRRIIGGYLLKAGYAVKIGSEKPEGKKASRYFVEYWEEEEDAQN